LSQAWARLEKEAASARITGQSGGGGRGGGGGGRRRHDGVHSVEVE